MPVLRLIPDLTDPGWRASRLTQLTVTATLVAAASLVPYLSSWSFFFELFSHFRAQYLVLLALSAGVLALGRRFPAALVLGFFALWQALLVFPACFDGDRPLASPGGPTMKLLVFNVHTENSDPGGVRALLEAERPDAFLIVELAASHPQSFGLEALGYEAAAMTVRADNFGIGLFARRDAAAPLVSGSARIVTLADDAIPAVTATFRLGALTLGILGIHPPPPMSEAKRTRRNAILRDAARFTAAMGMPGILAGDFNATPWAPIFGELLHSFGLRDSRRGFGAQPSWPTSFMPLAIPIDHALLTPGLAVVGRRIGPNTGSDHRPVVLTLAAEASPR